MDLQLAPNLPNLEDSFKVSSSPRRKVSRTTSDNLHGLLKEGRLGTMRRPSLDEKSFPVLAVRCSPVPSPGQASCRIRRICLASILDEASHMSFDAAADNEKENNEFTFQLKPRVEPYPFRIEEEEEVLDEDMPLAEVSYNAYLAPNESPESPMPVKKTVDFSEDSIMSLADMFPTFP